MPRKAGSGSWWRRKAAEVIVKVIAENPDTDYDALKKLISAAYPFGERNYHPYKIWLSEVKNQLALRFKPVSKTPVAVKDWWTGGELLTGSKSSEN